MNIIIGFIGIAAGILYLKYNYRITNMTGKFPWVETYLGAGGTYIFHKLLAILVIILSIMWMTGTLQDFIGGNVSKYFGGR